jgi:hypothetical protein
VQNYKNLFLKSCANRVAKIERGLRKSLYLSPADRAFLTATMERNSAFMRNFKFIVDEAVEQHSGIQVSVLQHAFVTWSESDELTEKIRNIMKSSTESLKFRHSSTSQESASQEFSHATPRRSPQTPQSVHTPQSNGSLRDIEVALTPSRKEKGVCPQPVVELEDRRALLELIELHSSSTCLSDVDLRVVQAAFAHLYGAMEGWRRYSRWFDEQALKALKTPVK